MRKIAAIFFLSLLLPISASATDYYVRPSGGSYGSENGTSYADAWDGFASINWTTLDAGNGTLWVDGVNNETMTVTVDGEAGFPIIIRGYGSSAEMRGIVLNSRSYVTVDGIKLINGTSSNGGAILNTSHNITLQNCEISGQTRSGVNVYDDPNNATDILIDNCIVHGNGSTVDINNGIFFKGVNIVIRNSTVYNNGYGDDATGYSHGIYVDAGGTSADIYNNTVYSNPKGHGIQSKSNVSVYNNKLYGNYNSGFHGGENGSNSITQAVYNNLIYSNEESGIALYSKGAGNYTANIYGNTFWKNSTRSSGSWYSQLYVQENMTGLNVKNNIFYSETDDTTVEIVTQSSMAADYNIHYGPSGNPIRYGGSLRTWAYWTGTVGADANGYNSNPGLSNPTTDFALSAGSIAIDNGATLGAPYNTDYAGVSRPVGSAYDIGAYEYMAAASQVPVLSPGVSISGGVTVR